MKFPASFTRYVGTVPAGKVALGGDSLPTGRAPANQDNAYFGRFNNVNGWPVHRLAVTYTGPSGAPTLTASMYFFEDTTQTWYQIGASGTLTSGQVTFFDVICIMEMPNTVADLANATPGSIAQILIVEAPGGSPASGAYTFCIGPDLTTQG